jgi:hypothetical protein
MSLALVAFIRLYFVTHKSRRQAASPPSVVDAKPQGPEAGSPGGSQGCRTLERSLEGVLRTPADPNAFEKARQQLDACPEPPPRACEMGAALEARSPLDAGTTTPARELLDALCQRCPTGSNPCASQVVRGVMAMGVGRPADPASLKWHLEHAGTGTAAACTEVVRSLLTPAALATDELKPPQREVLGLLAPVCARAEQLPAAVLHAAVLEGDVPALAQLVQTKPAGESAPLKPKRMVGAQDGAKAFDGQEATGVELTAAPQNPNWMKEGALSAVFESPVRQLTALRVRARGPGTLRAVIRTGNDLGLMDPETNTSFVLPVACRFRGTGQWETCALPVPLLDVEALSVFPEKALTLSEVEARGTP